MLLTFPYTFRVNEIQKEMIDEIIWHSAKVYNILNYDIKMKKEEINVKGNMNVEGSRIYKKYRKENWHSNYLHSHTLQQVILNAISDHKSYRASIEKYRKEQESKTKQKTIKREPREPRSKKDKIGITFTKYAIRLEKNKMKLSISKKLKEKFKVESLNISIPGRLKKLVNFCTVKMIKIKKKEENMYKMEIIYEKEIQKTEGTNLMSIDLGLNNLATCTNMRNKESMIVAGESLKSKIGYYNKEIARLKGIQMKMVGNRKYRNTKKINRLYEKRRNYTNTYLHKASRMIIEYAKVHQCEKIIIGELKGIKQEIKKNKRFVEMPIQRLVEKIEYKAELEGIEVIKIGEAYTSGVSSLDKEEINKEYYKIDRRIKRGLFKTNKGIIINADINGSINIMRKYLKSVSPNLEIAMDIGREQRPVKKRVA